MDRTFSLPVFILSMLVALATGIGIGTLVSGGNDESGDPDQAAINTDTAASGTGSSTGSTPSSDEKVPGEAQPLDLSGVTQGEELTVTFLSADLNPKPPDPAVYEVDAGSHWVNAEVTVLNTGGRTGDQIDVEYSFLSADGEKIVANGDNAFEPVISCCSSGYSGSSMQPGDKATGFVSFQLPDDFTPVTFRASDIFGESTAEWSIG